MQVIEEGYVGHFFHKEAHVLRNFLFILECVKYIPTVSMKFAKAPICAENL